LAGRRPALRRRAPYSCPCGCSSPPRRSARSRTPVETARDDVVEGPQTSH
jgi:hypothetical protein